MGPPDPRAFVAPSLYPPYFWARTAVSLIVLLSIARPS